MFEDILFPNSWCWSVDKMINQSWVLNTYLQKIIIPNIPKLIKLLTSVNKEFAWKELSRSTYTMTKEKQVRKENKNRSPRNPRTTTICLSIVTFQSMNHLTLFLLVIQLDYTISATIIKARHYIYICRYIIATIVNL